MREERRQELRASLVARLARVRGQMTDAEFDELVDDVERTAWRLAEIDAGLITPRRVRDESAARADGGGESPPEGQPDASDRTA